MKTSEEIQSNRSPSSCCKVQKPDKKHSTPSVCPGKCPHIQDELDSKIGERSFNLSMKGSQNLNSRSDCFWFFIFSITLLCLILLFYFISCSSRENKLLQSIVELSEQEKEIKLKQIEKCDREYQKCKECQNREANNSKRNNEGESS